MAAALPVHIPYCGLPPSPGTLLTRWNLDPVLITGLVVVAGLYIFGVRRLAQRGREPSRAARISFHTGWAITALAVISPLCALSVSLFWARCAQDMILMLLAAPLVILGRPGRVFRASVGVYGEPRRSFSMPMVAAGAFAVVLWFWHAPLPYAETFASTPIYWTMHFTEYGVALWLWAGLFDCSQSRALAVIGASIFSTVEMGFLGAIITFAPIALYTPYVLTTRAWGYTQIQDQQLGGAIMWVPGCFVFFLATITVFWVMLRRLEAAEGPRPSWREAL
ncbi:MAG: cytochrome c oxidase assembly protein [Acetobacteraceae bacterium]